jgi:hypothetical protein
VSKGTVGILLILAISVTPSVSDALQLYLTDKRYLAICVAWWLLLTLLLCAYWEDLT